MPRSSLSCPNEPPAAGGRGPEGAVVPARAGLGVYAGLLLASLAALAYELVLARIFSVTAGAVAAVPAVAVAMFGLTVGAILVYLRPRWFATTDARPHMATAAACFSVLVVACFLVHLQFQVPLDLRQVDSWRRLAIVAADLAILAMPLAAAGACLTIGVTQYPRQVHRLYAANLAGAALGCLAVATASRWIDAPTLMFDVAAVAAVAALCCASRAALRRLAWLAPAPLMLLAVLTALNLISATSETSAVRLRWIRGQEQTGRPIFDRWNSFSRVTVVRAADVPIAWGMSSRFPPKQRVPQLWVSVDTASGMIMTEFHGDLAPLDFLRNDVVNIVHYLRPGARVLVLGSGGGRDVLSALVFRQPEIVGVEVNDLVLEAVHGRFGDFTGHLDRLPNVRIVHDEARRYLARDGEPFDIIQAPLLDSWAASPGGDGLLVENGTYTVEAWQRMFQRLTDRGVASFSRWYSREGPGEIYRLAVVAVTALKRQGVAHPRDHLLVVVRPGDPKDPKQAAGMATLLASREPFSSNDIDTIERTAREMAFEVLVSPRSTTDDRLARLVDGVDLESLVRDFPIDIAAPTDDRPFFFGMIRPGDAAALFWPPEHGLEMDMDTLMAVAILLASVLGLAALAGIVPWVFSLRRGCLRGTSPWFLYFFAVGAGFMLVEVAMVQRLSLLLGHPVSSLTVTLFCLLSAGGAGSWLCDRLVPDLACRGRAIACMAVAAGVVSAIALVVLPWLSDLDGASTTARTAIAAALLVALGLPLGMACPLGMRAVHRFAAPVAPWLWGINGTAGLCGSAIGLTLSLCFGIAVTMLAGASCYLVATLALLWATATSPASARDVPQ